GSADRPGIFWIGRATCGGGQEGVERDAPTWISARSQSRRDLGRLRTRIEDGECSVHRRKRERQRDEPQSGNPAGEYAGNIRSAGRARKLWRDQGRAYMDTKGLSQRIHLHALEKLHGPGVARA